MSEIVLLNVGVDYHDESAGWHCGRLCVPLALPVLFSFGLVCSNRKSGVPNQFRLR